MYKYGPLVKEIIAPDYETMEILLALHTEHPLPWIFPNLKSLALTSDQGFSYLLFDQAVFPPALRTLSISCSLSNTMDAIRPELRTWQFTELQSLSLHTPWKCPPDTQDALLDIIRNSQKLEKVRIWGDAGSMFQATAELEQLHHLEVRPLIDIGARTKIPIPATGLTSGFPMLETLVAESCCQNLNEVIAAITSPRMRQVYLKMFKEHRTLSDLLRGIARFSGTLTRVSEGPGRVALLPNLYLDRSLSR